MVSAWAEPAPDVRVSDAERGRTIDLLCDAAAEGRLGFEELADRIDVAAAGAPRVILTGGTVFGDVRVRAAGCASG